jgi:hypothetical protein
MNLLKCKFEPGPMAHEVAIVVRGMEGEYESGFVPVRVIDEDAAGNRALVELPVEVIMGSRRIWVPLSNLRR